MDNRAVEKADDGPGSRLARSHAHGADDSRASGLAGQQPHGRKAGRQSGRSADGQT